MSKKRIIAIITVIVLLLAAGISVGVFLYGRGETEATDGSQTTDQNQVSDGNQTLDGEQSTDETQAVEGENNENPTTEETVENDNKNANNQSTNNDNVADNENDEENIDITTNAGTNTGVTTNTNVDNVGETIISRVEEQERLISEEFLDWWQPMTVAVKPTEVGVILPQITVKKAAITSVGDANLTYIDQDITYVIAVTNNSKTAVENIEVTDRIPANTTYVADSIEDAVILRKVDEKLTSEVVGAKSTIENENKVVGVKWIVSIPAGETVIAKFTVNVNRTMADENLAEVETTGTILNSAIANGEESNEVQTSIIRTHKSSVITRNDEVVETAKVGDFITYTISIENTGDVEGTTYVIDNVPAGTEFVSAQEGAKVTKSIDTSIIWSVTIPAHTTVTREFTVKVTNVEGLIKNVADVGGTPTNEDIIDTANIDVTKTATAVNGGAITQENQLQPVKVGDKIEYTIVVTNTGSRDLTNVLLQEQLDGVEITKLVVDGVEKAVEKDIETGKLIIGDLKAAKEANEASIATITATYIVSDKDIINKGNEDGTTIPVYNKVNVTGEIVPDPEKPDEVPEKVEDNDDETVPVAPDARYEVVKTALEVGKVGQDGKITFSAISGKVKPGDVVKYEIVVTNTGNTKLTNIEITDTLSVRIDSEDGELKEVDQETKVSTLKTIPSLVSGASEKIVTYYEVNSKDIVIGKLNENDLAEMELIENTVTAKTENLIEQDKEIVPVNPYISRKVIKTWIDDEDNKYGTRPANITVRLYDDGVEVDVATITAESIDENGNWTHEFTMLPKYNEDGTVIVYTITEYDVSYYAESVPTTDMQEYIITNTLDQEKISVPVTKTWLDNDNKYNTRPAEITVRLYADGNEVQVATITAASADQEGKWNHIFTKLPRYNGLGNEIVYTISEDDISDYDEKVDKAVDGYNITNTLKPKNPTSISGTKIWVDSNNEYNTRPSEITINLMVGQNIVQTQKVTAENNWKYSFTNLPSKDIEGKEIKYTIQELQVHNYSKGEIKADDKNPNIINIKNTIAQVPRDITGTKTWIVPSEMKITDLPVAKVNLYRDKHLYPNATPIQTTTITNTTNTEGTYTFTGLDTYDLETGRKYVYTVEEVVPDDYTQIDENQNDYHFTNVIDQVNITFHVTKYWKKPTSVTTIPAIKVKLLQNDKQYYKNGSPVEKVLELGTTTYSFGPLPKYSYVEENGKIIGCTLNKYEIVEVNPETDKESITGYQAPIYSDVTSDDGINYRQSITNIYAQENLTYEVEKIWRDLGENDSNRPTITISLKEKTTGVVETKTLTKDNGYKCSFTAPKYKTNTIGSTYELNEYSVEETSMANDGDSYKLTDTSTTTTGNTTKVIFTNTVNQDKTSIKANKEWNIPIKATGATGIKIYLYKNGEQTAQYVELDYEGTKTQTHTFNNLDKYKTNSDGTIYINSEGKAELNVYTVHEEVKENSQYIVDETINNNETVIKNTPKGIVEKIEIKPIDVVFVLDVSNSMNSKGRDAAMVDAINNTLDKIKELNSNSRVGIVTYNTTVTSITNQLTDIKEIGTFTNGTGENKDYIYYTYKENGEDKTTSIYVKNATYTAAGIEAGAAMLTGDTVITGRIPILILLSDGAPTYYKDENGKRQSDVMEDYGRGGETSPENIYYTIKTACHWKQKIDETYEEKANFYTIGLGIDNPAMNACLNPTATNVTAYSVQDTEEYKLEEGSNYSLKEYYDDNSETYGSLDYSDATYINRGVNKDELKQNLAEFISVTTQWLINESEIQNKKVVIEEVDTTKEFTITFGNQEYTAQNAPTGVLTINGTTYTVHLDALGVTAEGNTNQVYIKYYKIKQ